MTDSPFGLYMFLINQPMLLCLTVAITGMIVAARS